MDIVLIDVELRRKVRKSYARRIEILTPATRITLALKDSRPLAANEKPRQS